MSSTSSVAERLDRAVDMLLNGTPPASAAVGVGVTAFAVWRSTRRPVTARILHW